MSLKILKYLVYCKEQLGLSDYSIKAYRQDLITFQRFILKYDIVLPIISSTLIHYQRYLREKLESSPATIRRRFITLRSYFNWVEMDEKDTVSPFREFRLDLKVPSRLPRPVDRPTLQTLFKSTQHIAAINIENNKLKPSAILDQTTGLISRLLVVTGLRIGEITNLKISDISGACTRIRVRGKGNKERTVYVTNQRLLQDFDLYWKRRAKDADHNEYLFLNMRGKRLTEAAFRKRLRTVSKSLQIVPHITPHQFRHSAATLLIEEGVDIRIVQRLLGHASISTTEIYTKVSDNSLVSAIERADTLAQVDS